MIELKNVVKTYKSKKGHTTTALNNVSIKFDHKGMTFILGKSGSGKSTMLNVIGGLDKYDSGDIIILGKSTKNFKKADFDSYRNTYVGFVFQEFNILEDYNVYENIVLALQLQQKDIDENKIDELLEKLELKDLKTRKVNELSGGQKQRVAIARALIKDPKIILADEPTGNLDSKTGKQVMDLLKEISKEKLVIIVSHDNESANLYGDRIIEISDGNIIRDTKDNIADDYSDDYKIIHSKLPFKDSFKLGIGSLRHKKIKLIFTIILCIFSLLFLSITDTLSSYNINLAHSKLLKDQNEEFVQIEKYRWFEDNFFDRYNLKLEKDEIKEIQNRIGKQSYPVYRVRDKYSYLDIYHVFHIISEFASSSSTYGSLELELIETDDFSYFDKFDLIGEKPKANDEIVISNYIADIMIKNGMNTYGDEEKFSPKSYNDILNSNKIFYFGDGGQVKIVGIINYDVSKYESIIKKYQAEKYEELTDEEIPLYQEYIAKTNNIYNKVYTKLGFIESLDVAKKLPLDNEYRYQLNANDIKLVEEEWAASPSLISDSVFYYDGNKWVESKNLKMNEIVLNVNQLFDFDSSDYRQKLTAYINQNLNKTQLEAEKEFFEKYTEKYNVIGKKASLSIQESNTLDYVDQLNDLVVVGITGLITNNEKYYYLSSEQVGKYSIEPIQVTGVLVYENTQSGFKKLMDEFPYNEKISLKSTYSVDVHEMIRTINVLKTIAFYIGIVFVVFTVILITNFMFSSISYRKKEIGVLRALGSRSKDIVKIFLWEGLVMSFISATISAILLIIVTSLLNNVIMAGMSMILTPFILGIRQFVIIYLVVFIVTIISSILPIIKISKMKPIDAILNK